MLVTWFRQDIHHVTARSKSKCCRGTGDNFHIYKDLYVCAPSPATSRVWSILVEYSWFEFSFPSWPVALPKFALLLVGRRTNEFILSQRALEPSEKQIASSGIWTWVNNSIYYNDSHYVMHTSRIFVWPWT